MRRISSTLAVASAMILLVWGALPGGAAAGKDPERRLDQDIEHLLPSTTAPEGIFDNFTFVGHNPLLGKASTYGDVFALGDFAYVGSRCGPELLGGFGVQVVDISDPSNPTVVSTLPNPAFTRAEDVVVRHVSTPTFTGDLAAAGLQICFGSGHYNVNTGFRLYDVTHPADPVALGLWTLPKRSIGCHEIDLVQRSSDGRVLVGCAHNLNDQFDRDVAVDFVDVTNPLAPTKVGGFSQGGNIYGGFGCLPVRFAHSVRFYNGGLTAFVSYWDSGTVNLDVSDPSNPTVVGVAHIAPPDEDGDNHSMTPAGNGKFLIVNPEDFSPVDCGPDFGAWGEAWIVDNSRPAHPKVVGSFSTANSRSGRTDGVFTVHNSEVLNHWQVFSSWYSDGIVWWQLNPDGTGVQLGQFVPRNRGAPPAFDWGVFIDSVHDVILASDLFGGLWIVRPVGLGDF